MIDFVNCRAEMLEAFTQEQRFQVLERLVLDLMMEIEALRTAVIELSSPINATVDRKCVLEPSPGGVGGEHTTYGKAYLETAWLTHCSTGASSGWDKIVERFYESTADHSEPARGMRELLMLRRLGYDSVRVAEYCASAQDAETLT